MDSKKIKALLTSIERGSLTAAAQELGYTQSGLTHMMNSLEEELGLSLLIRSKAGVHLNRPILCGQHKKAPNAGKLEIKQHTDTEIP